MSGSYGTVDGPGPADVNGTGGAEGANSANEWSVSGYTTVRELGAGASGRVVLARHHETGTPVAVKYLSEKVRADDRFLAGFRAEARLLGALESPHVVQLYEYVETQSGAAIVMELVDGIPLRALLRQEGATGPEAALTVLKGSLLGLAAAHAAGVVHRDYKPDNVLVAGDGSSKLVDFGIALASGESGDIAGTPVYMAPEQWTGRPASPATDVYAATATFFECLTGAKPYAGTTAMELAVQHMEAPIPDDLAPEPVRPLIRSGLAKTPEDRPASASDFVAELEAVATAAYGEDWERRGQRKLAALAALLPLLFPSSAPGASGTTAVATTTLGAAGPKTRSPRRPRLSRRAKALAGATIGGLLTGLVALTAVAADNRSEARTDTPSATALSSVDGSPSGTGTTSVSPVAEATGSPTSSGPATKGASPTADASSSPTADSGGTPGGSGGGTTLGGGTTGGGTTGGATSSGGSTGGGSGGGSGGTSAPATTGAPQLDVVSVTIQASGPLGYGCAMVASVSVQTNGAADGTLTLTWFGSTSPGQTGPTEATDSISLPQGKTQVSGRYTHTFSTPDPYPYLGVKVTTSPAADSGNGSVATIIAPVSCNPLR